MSSGDPGDQETWSFYSNFILVAPGWPREALSHHLQQGDNKTLTPYKTVVRITEVCEVLSMLEIHYVIYIDIMIETELSTSTNSHKQFHVHRSFPNMCK